MNIGGILAAVVVFSALIFVHELGHFLCCKLSGVRVNEFALGMGPVVLSRQRGETRYALRLFPIGGFVAMEGENDESADPSSFGRASIGKRFAILSGGSAMNLLLGFVILLCITTQQSSLGSTVVAKFHEAASSSGQLQVGDEVWSVNGHRVRTDNDLLYELRRDRDGVMDMEVLRGGEKTTLRDVTFEMRDYGDGVQLLYLDFSVQGMPKTFLGVVHGAFNWTLSLIKMVWGSLVDLATGRYGLAQLSGPVGVTSAIGEATSMGWEPLLMMVAFITVNLGVFNLLPFPALDGGRLLFLLVELVRRKPLKPEYEGIVNLAGFALLIGLIIYATFNDIVRLITG